MLQLSDADRIALKLEAKASKSVQVGRSPGKWPERLPKTLTVRAMGGTWELLRKAPLAPSLLSSSSESNGDIPTMTLNDEAQAELSWQRYQAVLRRQDIPMENVKAKEAPPRQCKLCQGSISLSQHLTYTTCPSPFRELQPQQPRPGGPSTLSQFGFGTSHRQAQHESVSPTVPHCHDFFHIACLASHFSSQQAASGNKYVLPTHGVCPSCGVVGKDGDMNTWVEVIRGVYRRKEKLESEILKEKVAKEREEKMRARTTAKKSTSRKPTRELAAMPKSSCEKGDVSGSLLDALDEIQSRPRGKRSLRPVSTLLRDPIQPIAISSTPSSLPLPAISASTAKRTSLLCNLDNILNSGAPSQASTAARFEAKRAKSTFRTGSPGEEVIDLT
jgi:hypothetical protein